MLDYIQIYPETRDAVRRYPAADRALLYEAMLDYATTGQEPDWPDDDLKWFVWESLRQKVCDAERAHKRKQAAGSAGGRPKQDEAEPSDAKQDEAEESTEKQDKAEESNEKQNEAEESRPKQKKARQSKAKPESESESDAEPETVTNTHTSSPPEASRRRARAGWFDPEHPADPDDGAWRYSEKARRAVAQRIMTHVINSGRLAHQFSVTEDGQVLGDDLFEVLCTAMLYGMSPRECLQEADDWKTTWRWEKALRDYVISQGGTGDLPEPRMAADG